ncbi:hypothetical protein BBJK_00035 [Bifidobacterium bifidum LMG 13195]|uniref:Uncharacterized protein n=1 Tax=Bifidobacterium bifidum LMG 13195 TaxID=1207542 RepID=A0A286TA31_BIFBI|nr:hypothetical protein BBJK_00035 [Bifidobacterium bifidum LMG 13195]
MEAAIGMEIREHKSSFAVYVVLRVLVIAVAVLEFFNGDYEAVFLCILTLLLLLAPAFVQVRFRIELPSALEVIVLVFVFAAEILGEISSFYEIFPFWDTVLHTMNGFLAAAIGFSLVDLLNRSDRVKFELSPLYLAIVSFCFSMTIGVVWEFFEFSMDMMFGFDMQKDAVVHSISSVMLDPAHANHAVHINDITQVAANGRDLGLGGYLDIGLIDTMEDLIVNFIGAVVFSVIGFIYVKNRGKGVSVISRFVPRRKSHDRDYLRLAAATAMCHSRRERRLIRRNASPSTIHTTTITHDAGLSGRGERQHLQSDDDELGAMASTMFAVFGLPVLRSMDAKLLGR